MKVYLDDTRLPPKGWILVKTPKQTIELLKTKKVTDLSLDHDLGDDEKIGTGYDVLTWIEQEVYFNNFPIPLIKIHSANSVSRVKMELAIQKINNLGERNESK